MAAILANVFLNQIRILIQKRVTYDKELFNFEAYQSHGMNDERLVQKTIFMSSGKNLMKEYFTFQKGSMNMELSTANQVSLFLHSMAIHVPKLNHIRSNTNVLGVPIAKQYQLDLEPLLLVYFSYLANQKISKDSLSKVSKTFFKDLRMGYRQISDNFAVILRTLYHFFADHHKSCQGASSSIGGDKLMGTDRVGGEDNTI